MGWYTKERLSKRGPGPILQESLVRAGDRIGWVGFSKGSKWSKTTRCRALLGFGWRSLSRDWEEGARRGRRCSSSLGLLLTSGATCFRQIGHHQNHSTRHRFGGGGRQGCSSQMAVRVKHSCPASLSKGLSNLDGLEFQGQNAVLW